MADNKVAIIIVTYNASDYIGDCLSSLENINYPKDKYRIVIVDNASTDNTPGHIKKFFSPVIAIPPLREKQSQNNGGLPLSSSLCSESLAMTTKDGLRINLIIQNKNLGFAAGNNIGLKYAQEKKFDYAYLLNQDTVVDKNFLSEAIKIIEKDGQIAAVQSRLMHYKNKDLINSIGNQIHYLGFGYAGGNGKKITDCGLRIADFAITYPSGAAFLIKISALKEIGLFNKDFFMYHEDLDWGWRTRLMGYDIVLSWHSVVYHKYEFSRSIKKYYYMERNRYLVLFQNYKMATIFLIFPVLFVMWLSMFLYSYFGGWGKEQLSVLLYFTNLKNWRKIIKTRKAIQNSRKISDKEIIGKFSGIIEFQESPNPILEYFVNPLLNVSFFFIKNIIWW